MKRIQVFIFSFLFIVNIGTAQDCPLGSIAYSSQSQLDDFLILFPNCTEISGSIFIGDWGNGSDITDLTGLSNITSTLGYLAIHSTVDLIDLSGLENLINIGTDLQIEGNNDLTSLLDLENLSTVGGEINIFDNLNLSNCSALSICNHIVNGGPIEISNNAQGCNSINEIVLNCNTIGRINHPIFYDLNENGILEVGEPFYPYANVNIEPSNNSISYGNLINGGFAYQEFGDYTITYNPIITPDWSLTTDDSYDISLSEITQMDTVYFGITPITIYSEVQPSMVSGNLRCNTLRTFNIYGVNTGTSILDGILWIEVDPGILSIEYIDTPDTIVAPNLYGWHFNAMFPGAQVHKQIKLEIPGPPEFPLGDSLHFQNYITYNDMNGGYTSSSFEYSGIVECSYDPNDKLVNPVYPFNYALIDERLTYTIRFQNTGNAEAFDVVIRDTLDPNLDASTFQVIASSHDTILSTQLQDNQYLTFSFIDINLPDSTSNFEESQGYVMYRIQAFDSISEGTEIQNTASIYFDSNPPIVTNTTANTMVSSLDADEDEFYIWEDCDDTNAMINPGASEVCDDLDNDCNLQVDDGLPLIAYFLDADNDGFGNPNMPIAICDSIPPAGYVDNASDCDDNDDSVNPAATEIPNNGIDEDCLDGDLVVSTNELEKQFPKISPNPTRGKLNIQLPYSISANLSIKDYNGKTILSQTLDTNNTIDLRGFSSGIYIVVIRTEKQVWVERVVKI